MAAMRGREYNKLLCNGTEPYCIHPFHGPDSSCQAQNLRRGCTAGWDMYSGSVWGRFDHRDKERDCTFHTVTIGPIIRPGGR
jgi:hypothetical protein